MNRDELKELALIRLEDARVLLDSGRYEGAYYLCGYVVECGLKACIAKQTKQYDFPDRTIVIDSYTHDLIKLVRIAKLPLKEMGRAKNFAINWALVIEWSEESRYQKHGEKAARDLYSAITDEEGGIFQWIKQYW